jgi:molybdenum cofactor guanylyltransferase
MAGNSGVILAGGRSSRMGEDKAAMMFAGEPLLARVLHRIEPAVDDVLVIGPQSIEQLVPGVRVIDDAVPAVGPLSGLYTALRATTRDRVFLVGCDMPFVQPRLVRAMLALSEANAHADAVALRAAGRAQPLHAVYSRRCLPAVERALQSEDHSLLSLLARLDVVQVDAETVNRDDPGGLSTFNVNTPADWERALRLAVEDVGYQETNGGR